MLRGTFLSNLLALAVTSLAFHWIGFVHIGRLVIVNAFLLAAGGTFACRLIARRLACRTKVPSSSDRERRGLNLADGLRGADCRDEPRAVALVIPHPIDIEAVWGHSPYR
jgi:hypothetical protein